jgi:hypothetical protein
MHATSNMQVSVTKNYKHCSKKNKEDFRQSGKFIMLYSYLINGIFHSLLSTCNMKWVLAAIIFERQG